MDRQEMKRSAGPEYAFYDRLSLLKQKMRTGCGTALTSFMFWLLLLYCAYRLFWILILVVAFDDSDMTDQRCQNAGIQIQRTASNPAATTPRLIHQQRDLKSLNADLGLREPAKVLRNFEQPPFVTAITSDQFLSVQGLIKQIHTEQLRHTNNKNQSMKLIIYDLGLTSQELNVRTLHEYGGAVWLEPEARIRPMRLHAVMTTARKRGYALWQRSNLDTIITYTHPKMFEFFGEQRCYFRDRRLIDPTAIIVFNNPFIRTTIMEPWLKCVLNDSCVSPWKSRFDACFYDRAPKYTGCHKFDVSALSIVIHLRLSPRDFSHSRVAYTGQSYETEMTYFPEQPLRRRHRNYIIVAIVFVIVIMGTSNFWGPVLIACSGIQLKRMGARR